MMEPLRFLEGDEWEQEIRRWLLSDEPLEEWVKGLEIVRGDYIPDEP